MLALLLAVACGPSGPLKVATIQVDGGPTLRRFHARAKGRGVRILKRTSHITVTVSDEKKRSKAVKKEKS